MITRDENELLKRIKPGQSVRVADLHKTAQSAGIARQKRKTDGLLRRLADRGEVKFSPNELVITRPADSPAKAHGKAQTQSGSLANKRPTPTEMAPKKPSPVALAYADSGQSVAKAAELLFERTRHDRAFINSHMDAILKAWCNDAVRHHVASLRLKTWKALNQPTTSKQKRASTSRARRSVEEALLDFPLPGGKRLGDATGAEVAEAANDYRSVASDAKLKATWLESIAARVSPTKRVSDVLTPAQLKKLKTEAANA